MKIPTQQMEFSFSQQAPDPYFVSTHLGQIKSSQMGVTLVHEHIFNKYPFWKKESSENFTLAQLASLKKYGVQTIVDLTPYTHLGNYKQILEFTNINIVCCTGFYLSKYIPQSYKVATVEELVTQLSKQMQQGRGMTRIRPGILKVAGQGAAMTPLEERLFTAIGIVQQEYRIPVATHSPKGALIHLDRLIRAGADPKHIFISHLDKGISNKSGFKDRVVEIKKILDKGAYVLLCEFGNNEDHIEKKTSSIMNLVDTLLDSGYIKSLLISADSSWRWKNGKIHLKNAHTGGKLRTYEYVFTQIVPALKSKGLVDNDINVILVENPKRLFEC